MNQKLLLASVVAALTLTACSKPAEEASQADTPATEQVQTTDAAPADTQQAPETAQMTEDAPDHDDHDDHSHAGHDHSHADGDAYQCGSQTVHIAVHNHDGEMEAYLNHDGIEYDFDQNPANNNEYTSDNGFGDNQNTTLTIDGNKAVVTGDNNQVLLDCVKAS